MTLKVGSVCLLLLLMLQAVSLQMTCGPKVSPRMIMDVPCDMSRDSYCQVPGSAYPFSSVRRYIYENQGLMRRMYGDQRQSFILRNEIDDIREKYDSLSFFDPLPSHSPRRPAFGPRSMDSGFHYVTRESDVPASSAAPTDSTTTPSPSTYDTVSPLMSHLNVTTLPSTHETKAAVEADENVTTVSDSPQVGSTEPAHPSSASASLTTETSSAPTTEEPNKYENKKGVNACPVKEEVIAPFWANNTRGETLALLNVYPFEQYVHWEKCSFELKQMFCRDGCRCEQQYRLHRLLAFDPKNDCRGVFADWFRFPSCCICVCYDIPENPLLYRVSRRKARL